MKILGLDIETAPNLAHVWSLWNQNIQLYHLQATSHILCWAAAWFDTGGYIEFDSIHNSTQKQMLKGIHRLLEEADAVVHFNGKQFDIPTLNREFLLNKMLPPDPYKQIDLLPTVRRQFRFTSNKMKHVAQQLKDAGYDIRLKKEHAGHEMWTRCMAGEDKAWDEMEDYNLGDVETLEDMYYILRPWMTTHPNIALYMEESDVPLCHNCGSSNLTRKGRTETTKTDVNVYQRYRCNDCGTPNRSRFAYKQANRTSILKIDRG